MPYSFNVLGYIFRIHRLVVHNDCVNIKEGATQKVEYNYNGKRMAAYNEGEGDIYFAPDKSGHGESAFKGFKLFKNKKKLE